MRVQKRDAESVSQISLLLRPMGGQGAEGRKEKEMEREIDGPMERAKRMERLSNGERKR